MEMPNLEPSVEDAPPPSHERPHVFLLGAGASKAACLDGDKSGRKVPIANELIEAIGLAPLFDAREVRFDNIGFEALYSRIAAEPEHADLVLELEARMHEYFGNLELPDHPTVYDHLVLSLRPKDTIATFNWDPFLWAALNRCRRIPGPQARFLHGNVAVGYCLDHHPIRMGSVQTSCSRCGHERAPSKLLYPVAKKDYQDEMIAPAWRQLAGDMQEAFVLTVFGYSGPAEDAEAMSLLSSAWAARGHRAMEDVEIIDIAPRLDIWDELIFADHSFEYRTFYESSAARYPRRSVECRFEEVFDMNPMAEFPIPADADWPELLEWFDGLVSQESAH